MKPTDVVRNLSLGLSVIAGACVTQGSAVSEPAASNAPNDVAEVTQEPTSSIPLTAVRDTVREHAQQLRACYDDAKNEKAPGVVRARWVVDNTGKVTEFALVESSVKSKDVEDCIGKEVMTWTFPPPNGGGVVVITYPFSFRNATKPVNDFDSIDD
jgi:hypothetical protein